ncbi:prolyl oligopeptidase family serine peptidase [Massilia sp. H-1]|nr:prolyl oligopeptidase family serine peptidase [Massilia sp. H-1]
MRRCASSSRRSCAANNAARIKKPLFVIQGKNDPRVPYQEADQIVATVRKGGTPVWYMTANDEGHGFGKKVNADYQFFTSIDFLKTYLLEVRRPAGVRRSCCVFTTEMRGGAGRPALLSR